MIDYRTGRFTSSSIHKLVKQGRGGNEFSAAGLTYIKQKNYERMLGRSTETFAYSQAIAWGVIMEKIVFDVHLKDMDDYEMVSSDFRAHPDKEFSDVWAGTPDLEIVGEKISEIKCYQLEKYAAYTHCLMQKDVALLRKEFPQEYWQIVSNAILNRVDEGEAITFMPYREELDMYKDLIENGDVLDKYDLEMWQYRFIIERPIDELPYIDFGGHFNSITRFSFTIPQDDIDLLTERVRMAKQQLIKK